MTPLVRSKEPVPMRGRKGGRTGEFKVVYFSSAVTTINEDERFKDQIGCVNFIIKILEFNEEEGSFSEIKNESPIEAKYKFSTYLSVFGNNTINQFHANKAQLMINQIVYNNEDYWGLTHDDLEVVSLM